MQSVESPVKLQGNGNPSPSAKSHNTRTHYAQAYRDALLIQAALMRDIMNPETTAQARAQSARAWEQIEERKRIHRNKPLPGSLRPESKPRKRKASAQSLTPPAQETQA